MTRKQAFKMIDRLQVQLDALEFYISCSRIPEVRNTYKLIESKVVKKAIESLKNDLILTIVACKKDTL